MPAINVTIDRSQVERSLERLAKVGDFTSAMEQAQNEILSSIGENFRAQGRPTKWEQLSEITVALRRMNGRGGKILQDVGKLMQSCTPGSEGSLTRHTANELVVGTNLVYAAVHQFGATVKVKNARVLAKLLSAGGLVKVGPNQYRQQGDARGAFTKGGKVQKKFRQLGDAFNQVKTTKSGVAWAIFGKTVKIPARPFLVLQPEDEEAIVDIFKRHVDKQLEGE